MSRHTELASHPPELNFRTELPPVQELLDALANAIALLDARGTVVAANKAAEALFGGAGLPHLRSVPVPQKSQTDGKNSGEVLWRIRNQSIRIRFCPVRALLLLEGESCNENAQLRKELRAAQADAALLTSEHEELMCAYEIAATISEEARVQADQQNELIEQLLRSNLEFQALYEGKARDGGR